MISEIRKRRMTLLLILVLFLVPCKREYLTDFDNADDEIKEYIVKHGHCFEMNNTFLKGSPMFTTNSTGFRYIFGYDADHYYDYGRFFLLEYNFLSPIDQQLLSMFNPRKRDEIVISK